MLTSRGQKCISFGFSLRSYCGCLGVGQGLSNLETSHYYDGKIVICSAKSCGQGSSIFWGTYGLFSRGVCCTVTAQGKLRFFRRKRECPFKKTNITFQLKTERNQLLTEICEIIFGRDLLFFGWGTKKQQISTKKHFTNIS